MAKREQEMKKGGKIKKREEEVAELDKVLVKIRTQVEIKNGVIADEEGKVKESARELEDVSLVVITSMLNSHFPPVEKLPYSKSKPCRSSLGVL
jgi:hypothetical protein